MFNQKRAVVVRQLGGIGDILALSPVFRGIKEKYPNHRIQVITSSLYMSGALLDLMNHNPLIDDIVVIEPYDAATDETKAWWTQFGKADRLEDHYLWDKADYRVDLNVACIQGESNDIKAHGKVVRPRTQIWCEAAGVTPSDTFPIYKLTQEEIKEAEEYAWNHWDHRKVIGVGINAMDNKRAFPKEKIHEICHGLQAKGFLPVTIDSIFRFSDVVSVIGMKIEKLMPLISLMDAFVTVDSGLLHMAGTVGTPMVGIFGPTDHTMRMGEYLGSAIDSTKLVSCAPCWYAHSCLHSPDHRDHLLCLKKITPEIVVEEAVRWAGALRGQIPLRMAS